MKIIVDIDISDDIAVFFHGDLNIESKRFSGSTKDCDTIQYIWNELSKVFYSPANLSKAAAIHPSLCIPNDHPVY